MMLASNPSSPTPDHSPSPDFHLDSPSSALLSQSPPCWIAQARDNLAQAEVELRHLRERHGTETDTVKRGAERAVLGVRREEQRLLERVGQDHRDTQRYLEQVQRDNMAAVRVSQSLLEERFKKLAKLQQRVQEECQQPSLDESRTNQNLLKEIAEFLQPWEISVSLKKVNFKPSSQAKAIAFGDICVQEQSLSLHAGGCGPQGQLCALHSHKLQCGDSNHEGSREEKSTQRQGWTSPTGRVVRKISLSSPSNVESEEEQRCSSKKIGCWPSKSEQSDWESSQEDDTELGSFQPQEEEIFLNVPQVLKNKASDNKYQVFRVHKNVIHCSPRNQRRSLIGASGRRPSPSPERRWGRARTNRCLSLERQDRDKGKMSQDLSSRYVRRSNSARTREPLTSQSCLDLTAREQPHSCFSQSSDEHSLGTHGDSGRAPSPADSLDSSYTFIVSPSPDYISRGSWHRNCNLSKSAVDLTHKTRPLISNDQERTWRFSGNFNSTPSSASTSPVLSRGRKGHGLPYPSCRSPSFLHQPQNNTLVTSKPLVARSFSMSVIDGSTQEPRRGRGERGKPILMELEEEEDPSMTVFNPREVQPIRQFGKQGSGRADFTLPSGIHATHQGQLFIVDCGNARVQVTDPRGNILQQVSSPNSEGSARRCRNYFDLAVNSKGLIALSCAAERALLVFNRHGRLLQTFGGSVLGPAKDEFEAPRGVTVTKLDEFLVADIRKGALIALKLDTKTGCRLERTVVTGFHRPYLVAACSRSGMVAVSERGNETGRVPCIKVLEPGWNTVRVLGVCAVMGPVLSCPWGICIDPNGNVLVADWGEEHRVLLYPAEGVGWPIITQGLSSPRGLTLLPEGQLVVSDSMHHCIKIYKYQTGLE